MKKQGIKANNGVTLMDVVIAMIVLCLFVGIIGNLYYQIVLQNSKIRMNGLAVYYTVKVAEDIDKLPYEQVMNNLNNIVREKYEIPDVLTVTLDVEDYNASDSNKKDIIKIVTIRAEYSCFGEYEYYEVQKLKIKEIAKENS